MQCVQNSSPAKSNQQFIAWCNENRGKVTYASSGNGTTLHLCGELFKRLAKVEMTHIPYRGGEPPPNHPIPRPLDALFDNMPPVCGHVKAALLRPPAASPT